MRKQTALKNLMDQWMLQRFKSVIADQMPCKFDNVVFCRLAAEQEEVYMRVLDSPDYQTLKYLDDPCACGSGAKTKDCHPLNVNGVLGRWKHPDGDACSACPSCIGLQALSFLQKVANHLELIKPDPSRDSREYAARSDAAQRRFAHHHHLLAVHRPRIH